MRYPQQTFFQFVLLGMFALFPIAALGAVDADDLPAASTWYFHADFKKMRDSVAGKGLHQWVDEEVFDDIRDELGIDLAREVDRVTAFSAAASGVVIVFDGEITQLTKDKAMAAAASDDVLETLKSDGKTFYHSASNDDRELDDIELDGLEREGYFSFAIKNKVLVTSKREQMESLLKRDGKIAGEKSHSGALFVLTAEKSLIQAGMKTDEFGKRDDGFESKIFRNTEQVALLIADVAGNIAIEAQMLASEAAMAQSLASILRGLIALQAFSDDVDPQISDFLSNTRVEVEDKLLKVSVALTPEAVAAALDEV